ncbi:MAG: ParA family protein [Ureaplasma sp.]|nr:ParA family protein [Ureaplasma sp.]
MNKIISSVNNKGGCGKTTIASNLAIDLVNNNKKVLLIDLDGLCCINYIFNKSKNQIQDINIFSFLSKKLDLYKCIIKLEDKLDYLPASDKLQQFDIEQHHNNLKTNFIEFFNWLKNSSEYDYIVIDSSPQMSNLNKLIIELSDLVVVPFEIEQTNLFSLISTIQFISSKNQICKILMLPNKCRIDNLTGELKLNKIDKEIYDQATNTILANCKNAILSDAKIINSSQFKNSIAKYNLPLLAINSNSKIYKKAKKCINNLTNLILNLE